MIVLILEKAPGPPTFKIPARPRAPCLILACREGSRANSQVASLRAHHPVKEPFGLLATQIGLLRTRLGRGQAAHLSSDWWVSGTGNKSQCRKNKYLIRMFSRLSSRVVRPSWWWTLSNTKDFFGLFQNGSTRQTGNGRSQDE